MPRRPNVLLIMTDHQRGDSVTPGSATRTPHLDALASAGVRLNQTYCPSPHCSPARATFHTGLYPSRHGVWNNVLNDQALATGLRDGVRLWSERLAEADYRMAWSGKWHVDRHRSPRDFGWDERMVSATGDTRHGPTWDGYHELARSAGGEETARGYGEIVRPGYGDVRLFGRDDAGSPHDEKAIAAAIDALGDLTRGSTPWALWVGMIGPHDPYNVPGEFLDRYPLESITLPPSFDDDLRDKPNWYRRLREQIWGQLSPDEVRDAIRHFRAYTTYLDDRIGRVLAALDASGQAEDTIVLFCSDHGDYCGDHGLFVKGIASFRGAYHVPAILRWPGGIARPGRSDDRLVSLADFGPTLLDLLGLPAMEQTDGLSLAPMLRGDEPADAPWRDALLGMCQGVELSYTQRWIQTEQYRYVFNGFDYDELYDLHADPHEMRNLAANPAFLKLQQRLAARMWQLAEAHGDAPPNNYFTVGLAPAGPAWRPSSGGTSP